MKIKNCKKCGGEGGKPFDSGTSGHQFWSIECQKCFWCPTPNPSSDTPEDAIKYWNKMNSK